MAGEKWRGFDEGDIKFDFDGDIFNVHRAVVALASPVWKAMLTEGTFAESESNTIHFKGDDPLAARLCIALIYHHPVFVFDITNLFSELSSIEIGELMMCDSVAFGHFVDKYDLSGVKRFLAGVQDTINEKQVQNRKVQHTAANLKRLRDSVRQRKPGDVWKTLPGIMVDVDERRPSSGTRVQDKKGSRQRALGKLGVVFDDDDDYDETGVSVRWDTGKESHYEDCHLNYNTSRLVYA